MDREKAFQWAAALRSGEFTQGFTVLTRLILVDDENYREEDCCLGVECKLAIRDGLNLEVRTDNWGLTKTYDENIDYLPLSVRKWGDFKFPDPYFSVDNRYVYLAGLNDTGFTFSQIADLIEYFYEEL